MRFGPVAEATRGAALEQGQAETLLAPVPVDAAEPLQVVRGASNCLWVAIAARCTVALPFLQPLAPRLGLGAVATEPLVFA